jgi:hypothetical protein
MGSFEGAVLIILIIIIIFLLFILKIFWEVFATSLTLKLLQNNSGNYSTQKILVWVFVMISIVLLINFFSKKRTIRASRTRSQE